MITKKLSSQLRELDCLNTTMTRHQSLYPIFSFMSNPDNCELCTIITIFLYLRPLRLKCQIKKSQSKQVAEPGNTPCHTVWLQCSLATSMADADGGNERITEDENLVIGFTSQV